MIKRAICKAKEEGFGGGSQGVHLKHENVDQDPDPAQVRVMQQNVESYQGPCMCNPNTRHTLWDYGNSELKLKFASRCTRCWRCLRNWESACASKERTGEMENCVEKFCLFFPSVHELIYLPHRQINAFPFRAPSHLFFLVFISKVVTFFVTVSLSCFGNSRNLKTIFKVL